MPPKINQKSAILLQAYTRSQLRSFKSDIRQIANPLRVGMTIGL
jgi:hypothetical protein